MIDTISDLFPRAQSTRRHFLQGTGACLASAFAASAFAKPESGGTFNPRLMTAIETVWSKLEAMSALGPRFTGNAGHVKFVDSLDEDMRKAGLTVSRDTYRFPRWEAKKWGLKVTPKGGSPMEMPIAFYYPHSGQTGPEGVTGQLVYVGKTISDGSGKPDLSVDLKGKIAVMDYEIAMRDYNEWYEAWGYYTPDNELDKYITSVIAVEMGLLTEYKKAGAAGVIINWSNLSNGQSTNQNMPFGRPLQGIPSVLVDHTTGAKMRELAANGATASLILEADLFPDSATDTVVAVLPGSGQNETVILTTHTDGPNAIQENAGVALVALAQYFAKVPKSSRQRTIIFALTTGHDNGAYVPSTEGFIQNHPDMVKKAVASIAVEHLGCREWRDTPALEYKPTGKDELTYAITRHEAFAKMTLECAADTAERRVAAVRPTPKGRYLGVGGSMAATGMPTLGYYASPTYLNQIEPDGCMSRLSKTLMNGQLAALAKLVHRLDAADASSMKWLPAARTRAGSSQG